MVIAHKVNDIQGADYTNYPTIGRQNGTIKLKQTIQFTEGLSNFDLVNFDTNFMILQQKYYIAQAIRDDIFVDDLLIEYNKLFPVSIR